MQCKLALKKVSPNGTLIAEVTCLSGYVSVFRSGSPEKIDDYEQSLFDEGYPGHFVFEIDGAPLTDSEEVSCVGVGAFAARRGAAVRQLLLNAGYTPQRIEELSGQCQIKEILNSTWNVLSSEDLRKIEILVALRQKGRVVLMKDPFVGMTKESREFFAAFIAQTAAQDSKIVVISRLTDRPDAWVGNAAIARIDLDLIRQATIGFDPALLEQMRSRVANQAKSKEPAVVPLPAAAVERSYYNYKYQIIAATCLVLVIASVGSVFGVRLVSKPAVPVVAPEAPVEVASVVSPPVPAVEVPAVPQVLAQYSPEIGESILSAFRGEDENLPLHQEDSVDLLPVTDQQKRDNTRDIFKSIQEVEPARGEAPRYEDNFYAAESAPSFEGQQTDDWESAREEMRRKFLESLS